MWLLNRNNVLYLMKENSDKYLEKLTLDPQRLEDVLDAQKKLNIWMKSPGAPSTIKKSDGPEPLLHTVPPDPVKQPGTQYPKPPVIRQTTPNKSSRNGVRIRGIVMHCTTTRSDQSTIAWFEDSKSQVSAHYLIGQSGTIYQFVNDAEKAWHAQSANGYTIGIEHSALPGDKLTPAQEAASVALLKYLVQEYNISLDQIVGHRHLGQATSCPNALWPTAEDLKLWVNRKLGGVADTPTMFLSTNNKMRQVGPWAGLLEMDLRIGNELFSVASGAVGCQKLRLPEDPRSVPGNKEPIPQGVYKVGNIDWANGKDNYNASWGPGLGPVWVGLTATFSDDRQAFGMHLDENINFAAGSAGCVVFPNVSELERFVAAMRTHDPKLMEVKWNL